MFKIVPIFTTKLLVLLMAAATSVGVIKGQSSFELQELNTTLQVAAQKIQALEAQIAASKDKNDALAQSAAASSEEAAELKDRYERLRGLLEGLGIAALEHSADQTQQRLLSSLSDLRISETSRQKLAESLMELAEASLQFAKTVKEPEAVTADRLQKALVSAEATLAGASGQSTEPLAPINDLQDARIVSLKNELGIAVLNVGVRDGVKPGMPFEIFREDKPIAKVLVTEVRNSVSGAIVQDLANVSNPVRVGDKGKVDTNRSL
jgi:outer membrane murein-binding lipoprotein Lpp